MKHTIEAIRDSLQCSEMIGFLMHQWLHSLWWVWWVGLAIQFLTKTWVAIAICSLRLNENSPKVRFGTFERTETILLEFSWGKFVTKLVTVTVQSWAQRLCDAQHLFIFFKRKLLIDHIPVRVHVGGGKMLCVSLDHYECKSALQKFTEYDTGLANGFETIDTLLVPLQVTCALKSASKVISNERRWTGQADKKFKWKSDTAIFLLHCE